MSKLTKNRVIFFLLGTFLGSWILGMLGNVLRIGKKG